jgi:hypothetical protein
MRPLSLIYLFVDLQLLVYRRRGKNYLIIMEEREKSRRAIYRKIWASPINMFLHLTTERRRRVIPIVQSRKSAFLLRTEPNRTGYSH